MQDEARRQGQRREEGPVARDGVAGERGRAPRSRSRPARAAGPSRSGRSARWRARAARAGRATRCARASSSACASAARRTREAAAARQRSPTIQSSVCGAARSPPTRWMKISSSVPWPPAPACRSASEPCATRRPCDHADVVAEPLDDLEDVRGEEDRAAPVHERREQVLDLAGGDGVDALEGLVEEEQARRRQERHGERHLLAHAVRVVGDERVLRAREIHEREQLPGAALDGGRREAVHLAHEAQRLAPRSGGRRARGPRARRPPAASPRPGRRADRSRGCACGRRSGAAGPSGT